MSFLFSQPPLDNFISMYKGAVEAKVPEPHAMVLSTIGENSKPSSRIVYYKQIIRGEVAFFTNYQGRKSLEIEHNPNVALNFFWPSLEQQIRIEGRAEKTTREESETYFRTRARLSQIGAWASHQSQKLSGYEKLEEKVQEYEKKFAGQDVPCPPHWGGYRVVAERVEFWFGKSGRLHERYVYERKNSDWDRFLLNP